MVAASQAKRCQSISGRVHAPIEIVEIQQATLAVACTHIKTRVKSTIHFK